MQPFVPSDQNLREFSLRAVLIGLVMAVVLGSANAYLGLKAGMTIAATYPAAVIGMALIKLMKGTILEENMARTVGSIGESVAAGAIFTIPAFVISGIWPKFFTAGNYITSSLIMFTGGVLGIMFVALLRRVMVEDAELPYPESVAAAEIHKAGARGGSGTTFLFGAMGLGAGIQALVQLSLFASAWEKFAAFKTATINLAGTWKAKVAGGMLLTSPGISPAYMGVGYIIGPKLGALNFSGGIMAWGLLVPIITYFLAPGVLPEGAPQSDWIALSVSVWKFIVRPIAIGGMLMGACFTLFKMRKSLMTGLTRSVSDVKKAASGDHVVDRVNKDLPFTYVLGGLAFAAAVTFLITWQIFHVAPLVSFVAALVMVILGFFFAAISGYLVGIMGSSNNPISGLTLTALVLTALVMVLLGVKGREGVAAVLGVAAIVCVSAAVAGEMLQDLKAGHILGGTPWRMEMGDLLGVALASIVLFIPLMVLHEGDISAQGTKRIAELTAQQVQVVTAPADANGVVKTYTLDEVKKLPADQKKAVLALDAGFGSKQLAAPQAGLMALLSRGIVEGKMAWPLIIVGMMMGLAFILMQVKSPMLVSVGMYLPLETTFAIFLGGLIKGVVEMVGAKRGLNEAQKVRVENNGVLLAAGLIAGEALVGLVFASLAFFEVKYKIIANPGMFWISLVILAGIAIYLVRVPLANAGAADEPAPPSANF
ncbi:OPT family oligopeptide transporter [Geothrix sp. PMB-07]|uniref:OPT family oligopeptide transporter n=1 Tax=Geothrix sp. PMB-07 TaxID=3068640 RepID=UPI0027404983|nr:oligopeptide transporter, OPT family [Geothrix sp. PMB-07]WLT31282.1 oligopeptide transporter, OPT family [Geothrix sp. PMB-07]